MAKPQRTVPSQHMAQVQPNRAKLPRTARSLLSMEKPPRMVLMRRMAMLPNKAMPLHKAIRQHKGLPVRWQQAPA